jgi:hypothetical protein
MGLQDVTGVFSRYFVVGFFLPAYAALVLLWLTASSEFIPDGLQRHSEGTQLLILGAVALVVGLALSGVSYEVTRLFEGYPLERMGSWPVVGRVYRTALKGQRTRYEQLVAIRDDEHNPDKEVQRAAQCLARFFPERADRLLPTRLGNAIRAFERHSNQRWGLDGVTIWPRIDALLSADERELHVDAKTTFYVFVNTAVGALAVGACLVVDEAIHAPHPLVYLPFYAIPFALAYVLYRAAIEPATGWGDCVRSSVDLHRLEIYEKLGVRAPTSFTDEKELAGIVNQFLLYGQPPLDDDLWREEKTNDEKSGGVNFMTFLKTLLRESGT